MMVPQERLKQFIGAMAKAFTKTAKSHPVQEVVKDAATDYINHLRVKENQDELHDERTIRSAIVGILRLPHRYALILAIQTALKETFPDSLMAMTFTTFLEGLDVAGQTALKEEGPIETDELVARINAAMASAKQRLTKAVTPTPTTTPEPTVKPTPPTAASPKPAAPPVTPAVPTPAVAAAAAAAAAAAHDHGHDHSHAGPAPTPTVTPAPKAEPPKPKREELKPEARASAVLTVGQRRLAAWMTKECEAEMAGDRVDKFLAGVAFRGARALEILFARSPSDLAKLLPAQETGEAVDVYLRRACADTEEMRNLVTQVIQAALNFKEGEEIDQFSKLWWLDMADEWINFAAMKAWLKDIFGGDGGEDETGRKKAIWWNPLTWPGGAQALSTIVGGFLGIHVVGGLGGLFILVGGCLLWLLGAGLTVTAGYLHAWPIVFNIAAVLMLLGLGWVVMDRLVLRPFDGIWNAIRDLVLAPLKLIKGDARRTELDVIRDRGTIVTLALTMLTVGMLINNGFLRYHPTGEQIAATVGGMIITGLLAYAFAEFMLRFRVFASEVWPKGMTPDELKAFIVFHTRKMKQYGVTLKSLSGAAIVFGLLWLGSGIWTIYSFKTGPEGIKLAAIEATARQNAIAEIECVEFFKKNEVYKSLGTLKGETRKDGWVDHPEKITQDAEYGRLYAQCVVGKVIPTTPVAQR